MAIQSRLALDLRTCGLSVGGKPVLHLLALEIELALLEVGYLPVAAQRVDACLAQTGERAYVLYRQDVVDVRCRTLPEAIQLL